MSELDWQSLSDAWKAAPQPDVAPLRRIVAVNRRRLLTTAIGEIAMVLGFLALSYFVARDGVAFWEGVWMATLWGFLAVAAGFAWWNRRGTWKEVGDSVEEYVRLSRLRCERQRRAIAFAIVLFLAEAVAIMAQLLVFARLTATVIAALSAAAIVIAAWCFWVKRRIDRELKIIDTLAS